MWKHSGVLPTAKRQENDAFIEAHCLAFSYITIWFGPRVSKVERGG